MNSLPNDSWQKHLDELEEHYHPDRFFIEQPIKPTNALDIEEHFFAPSVAEETGFSDEAKLAIDISQDEKNLFVIAPLAGANPNALEVILEKDVLTIRGERSACAEETQNNCLYRECYWGKFSRSIILPAPVQEKGITAHLTNGVLKITLPKAQENERIAVKVKISG
jgi:HSP20 family protein